MGETATIALALIHLRSGGTVVTAETVPVVGVPVVAVVVPLLAVATAEPVIATAEPVLATAVPVLAFGTVVATDGIAIATARDPFEHPSVSAAGPDWLTTAAATYRA